MAQTTWEEQDVTSPMLKEVRDDYARVRLNLHGGFVEFHGTHAERNALWFISMVNDERKKQ